MRHLILLAIFLTSCRHLDDTSRVKHDMDGGSRARQAPLTDCHKLTHAEVGLFSNYTQVANKYLEEIASALMAANPKYFSGAYTPDHFCFTVGFTGSALPTAMAAYDTGQIIFDFEFVLALENAEQIAAVMSHELSHVVMRHGAGPDDVSKWQSSITPPTVPQNRGDKTAMQVWHNDFVRWTEREADEVGYEIYRNAALPRASFRGMLLTMYKAETAGDPQKLTECFAKNVKAQPPVEPAVGKEEHPTTCWRIFDFEHIEPARHAADLAAQDQRVGADRTLVTKTARDAALKDVQDVMDKILKGVLQP